MPNSTGASSRASQALRNAARVLAAAQGRDDILPDDVKRLAVPVFAHRVTVNSRGALGRSTDTAKRLIQEILTQVEVPL